jgi:uncharacterized delta-60 repeat protein
MNSKFLKFTIALMLFAGIFSSCTKNISDDEEESNTNIPTVSLENSFGENGRVIIPNTSEISLFDFDRHGNIIAVGYTLIGGGKHHLTIAKTNANGTIDKSFGDSGLTKLTEYDNSSPIGLKITNDNKILILGSFTKAQFQGRETLMMRFNEDGTVDRNFGDNGKVNLNYNAGYISSLNFDNDNFMLIAREEGETIEMNGTLYYNHTGYSISKYNYSGEFDNSFGQNGIVHLTNFISPYCMKILNNGSIIIAGTYNTWPNIELGLCKLSATGRIDQGFANNGIWHKDIMQDFDLDHEYFSNILEDKNGNLILLGSGLRNSQGWGNRAFLCKFSSNGKLDTNFGKKGFYCFDFGGSNKPIFQIGDKYITSGWLEDHRIVCVNKNGTLGSDVYTCGIYYFQDMKLQGNNRIILGGGSNMYNANFALERVVFD